MTQWCIKTSEEIKICHKIEVISPIFELRMGTPKKNLYHKQLFQQRSTNYHISGTLMASSFVLTIVRVLNQIIECEENLIWTMWASYKSLMKIFMAITFKMFHCNLLSGICLLLFVFQRFIPIGWKIQCETNRTIKLNQLRYFIKKNKYPPTLMNSE